MPNLSAAVICRLVSARRRDHNKAFGKYLEDAFFGVKSIPVAEAEAVEDTRFYPTEAGTYWFWYGDWKQEVVKMCVPDLPHGSVEPCACRHDFIDAGLGGWEGWVPVAKQVNATTPHWGPRVEAGCPYAGKS